MRVNRSSRVDRDAFAHGQGDLPLGSKLRRPCDEQALVNAVGEWAAREGHLPMRINNGVMRSGGRFIRFVRFWKMRDESHRSVKMCPPDMFIQHRDNGLWATMELKDIGNSLSDGQRKFRAEVSRRRGLFFEVRTLEDAQRAMRILGRIRVVMPEMKQKHSEVTEHGNEKTGGEEKTSAA